MLNSLNLTTYLTSNMEIDEDIVASIVQNCKRKTVKKDEFLLRKGEYSHYIFFVESGLLRQYSIDEKGKEHILGFAPENWFVSDRESIYFNQPSSYFIQALEYSTVALLDDNFLKLLSTKVPAFRDYNNKLLHNHIRSLQKRINQLLSDSAEERYLQFVKRYPDILLRVPQTMVASYLGITPESLSRLRKDLAHRNFKSKIK